MTFNQILQRTFAKICLEFFRAEKLLLQVRPRRERKTDVKHHEDFDYETQMTENHVNKGHIVDFRKISSKNY